MTKREKNALEQCDAIYRGQRRGTLFNRSLVAHQKPDKRVYLGLQHREMSGRMQWEWGEMDVGSWGTVRGGPNKSPVGAFQAFSPTGRLCKRAL